MQVQYFRESDDRLTRIGKVIGDAIALLVYIGIFALLLYTFLR